MSISDLKAMYDFYHEMRGYFFDELKNYNVTSTQYKDLKEKFEQTQEKYYNTGKQLEAAVEAAYEKEIIKN